MFLLQVYCCAPGQPGYYAFCSKKSRNGYDADYGGKMALCQDLYKCDGEQATVVGARYYYIASIDCGALDERCGVLCTITDTPYDSSRSKCFAKGYSCWCGAYIKGASGN